MEPITGSLSVTLEPATITPPPPPHAYFGVAERLMPGVNVLAGAGSLYALAFVAGHVLECLLKAYLTRGGGREGGHNLKGLWEKASKEQGSLFPRSPPSWVDVLHSLHADPCFLRYARSVDGSRWVNGFVLPVAEPMTSELTALLEAVREQLRVH